MKKSLLALAVLSAFAGAASAQTNVTIYGVVDAAITRTDFDNSDATWSLDSSSDYNKNGSRIGFKGTEDLGGGLSAIFTLENGFGADNGTLKQDSRLFGRQAWVGLQGGFGAVKLGRQYTPMFNALDTIDPFNNGYAGALNTMFNANGVRTDNTVNYSYSAAGFTGQLAYTFGEVAGSTSEGREVGLGLGYANGPLNVQFAYHRTNANPTFDNPITTAVDPVLNETKTAFLGASYDLGVAKLHAAFQTDKSEADATGDDVTKNRNWMLGVSAPVGAGTVLASYIRKDDRLDAEANEADRIALGYVHNLSKRTNLYTSYARINDRSNADNDGNRFNVGLQHKF